MKHDDSIQGVLIQSVLRHCGGRVRFRLCRTAVALIPIIPIILGASSCRREAPPEPYVRTIELEALDASCTEAWLRVRFTDSAAPRAFALKRDGQTILSVLSTPHDTLVIDEGLLPNRTYTYRAYRLAESQAVDSSALATLTTMDTTSHNFTWQIDTLGDGGGSVLYDVAIINDTLAYAVGEIYKRDSLGNWDPNAYNLVKWNGQRWQLLRIQFYTFCGQAGTGSYPAKSIFAFGPDDIWIAMNGSQVVRWNGQAQSSPECTPVSINKLWGENRNSIWAVGNNGQIAHYDGVRWRRIESGTTLPINDVWGSPEGSVVWACGRYSDRIGTYLFRGRGTVWEIAYDGTFSEFVIRQDSLSGAFSSVWMPTNKWLYVATPAGVYRARPTTRGEGRRLSFASTYFPGFPNRLRGRAMNDWTIVGYGGMVAHFNGITWRHFTELIGPYVLWSVDQRGNTVVAVGEDYNFISRAVVVRGRR